MLFSVFVLTTSVFITGKISDLHTLVKHAQDKSALSILLQEIERRKAVLRNEIPEEPDSDDPNTIKILLKLPNGIRLERRFLKTDSLKVCGKKYLQSTVVYEAQEEVKSLW